MVKDTEFLKELRACIKGEKPKKKKKSKKDKIKFDFCGRR